MIPAEWIHHTEKELTPEQVKRLEAGAKVTRIFEDRHGEMQRMDFTVVSSGKKKVLMARVPITGEKIVRQIKPNENCRYVVAKETGK